MPRLIPNKRTRTPEPLPDPGDDAGETFPPTPLPVWVPGRLRVRKTFTCEGVLFERGAYVSYKDSPLVEAILREYPGVFESAPPS
jgi:hypothetical protein